MNACTAKADFLILDDFGLTPLPEQIKRDLLEILDDRYDRHSTLITSQLPVEQWRAYLQDPTLADAILDRLIHIGTDLLSKATRCVSKKLSPPSPRRQKVIDENRSLNESMNVLPQPARHHVDSWPVIRWKHWPTCVESAIGALKDDS